MIDVNSFSETITKIELSSFGKWLTHSSIVPKVIDLVGPLAASIALIVNFPKVYSLLRGTSIKIKGENFSVVERVPGLVDFQLDVCISAFHGNVTLEKISLVNRKKFYLQYNEPICLYNEPDINEPTNQGLVKLAIPKTDFKFTEFAEDRFNELFCMKLRESQIEIMGLHIPKGSFKCLTMVGRLKGKSIDGKNFSNIPLEDWSVVIEFEKGKATATLQPLIIDEAQTRS